MEQPLSPAHQAQLQQIKDSSFLDDLRALVLEMEHIPANALEYAIQQLQTSRSAYEDQITTLSQLPTNDLIGHPERTGGQLALPVEEDRKLWIRDFREAITLIDRILNRANERKGMESLK